MGVSLAWGQVNSLAKKIDMWNWGIEGNSTQCLVIVVAFMGFGGAKR